MAILYKFDNCAAIFTSLYLLSEHNYISVDCFTCGICNILSQSDKNISKSYAFDNTDNIINDIIEYLKPENFTKQKIMRGNSL